MHNTWKVTEIRLVNPNLGYLKVASKGAQDYESTLSLYVEPKELDKYHIGEQMVVGLILDVPAMSIDPPLLGQSTGEVVTFPGK